ncbi:MAG: TatD family hydrolase [Thermotogae bacterium]|nr:TatD family hydrolase [Thermotogota bacterium]
MTDTHSHLNDPKLMRSLDEVVRRAKEWGVGRINVVGYDIPSSERAIDIARRYDGVYAVVGLHPYEAERYDEGTLARLETLLGLPEVVAVGEIGLDYYRGPDDRKAQRELFIAQISLAERYSLPVVLHVRDAFEDTLAIVGDFPNVPFVFHSFSGDARMLERVVAEANRYVSFSGMITFLGHVRAAARISPRERTFVETDAPYLAPVPKRGRRNEPAYVKFVLEALADLWNVDFAEAEALTDGNALRFFRFGER